MTDQSSFTGRYDKIHAPTLIRTRAPKSCAFEAWGEDELARMMRKDMVRSHDRRSASLHGGGWIKNEYGAPTTTTNRDLERAERAERHENILSVMEPGVEYEAAQLADALGWSGKRMGSQMRSLRIAGKVTGRKISVTRPEGGAVITLWTLA